MPRYRALVSTYKSSELPKDWVTNSVYFDDHGVGTDATQLATDIATLFGTYRSLPLGWDRVNCRLYDMAEPAPRQIQGQFTYTATPVATASGPREVALCLSFYGDANLPSHRGRIYIGPWGYTSLTERPTSPQLTSMTALQVGLRGIGGVDVDWCVFSPKLSAGQGWTPTGGGEPDFEPISGGWVDDEWDTVRSRGLRLVARGAWTGEE
jgi:hypothetical protein